MGSAVMDVSSVAIALQSSRLLMVNFVDGTLRWQAPELLDGAPKTLQSDVYAFGMLIFEVSVALGLLLIHCLMSFRL